MTRLARTSMIFALSIAIPPLCGIATAQAQDSPLNDFHIPVEPVLALPDPPSQFRGPETLTPPFGLQIVNSTVVVHTSTFEPDGVLVAHNPSVVFNFPITPDIRAYLDGGMHFAYKAIGWVGHIYTEACLTDSEALQWPGRVAKGPDSATCLSKPDIATHTFTPRQWYQVADARADLYVVQSQGFVLIPTPAPVNIQQIVVPLRFHLSGYTYYYPNNHTGPNDLNAACSGPACGPRLADVHTPAFNLVVAPAALMQIKALPETIVYLPPGNRSNGTFSLTKTFGTTITAGETVGIDNTNSQNDWTQLVSGGDFTGNIAKVLDLGFSGSSETRWDRKTTIKAGQSLDRDLQGVNQTATAFARTVTADADTIPGPDGPFEKQPFWGDLVVILVHPQLAVWDFFGRPIVQQFAASSAGGLPNDIAIPVSELDACANGMAPFQNGYAFMTASHEQEVLTAEECRNLAALDPFWGKGQSADLTGRGQLMVASQAYGIPVVGPQTENSLDIQAITSDAETVTNTTTVTYESTVESILATSWSAGIKFGLDTGSLFGPFDFGLGDSVTLSAGESIDAAVTMSLNYSNSSATTYREDILTEGNIDDNVNRGYSPHVEVYRDDIFGSLIFRDPDALCSPLPECRSVAPLGPSSQIPRRRHAIAPPHVHPTHRTTH